MNKESYETTSEQHAPLQVERGTMRLDAQKLRSQIETQGLPQVELARRSGVSRAQLVRILAGKQTPVRPSTLNKLAAALGVEPISLAVGGATQRYLGWLREQHGFIDFRGIGLPQLQRQAIDDLFVEPLLKPDPASDDCESDRSSSQPRKAQPSLLLSASKAIQDQERIVILGDPGTGKTTLLRWFAHREAKTGSVLPLFLRLSELARALEIDPRADPVQVISRMAADRGCHDIEGLLREHLAAPDRCLVLLDGLDEVGQEDHRARVVETVARFISQYPQNRFVLTSRSVGFEPRPWSGLTFSVLRIENHGEDQLVESIGKWARIIPRILGDRSGAVVRDSLRNAIFGNPRVRALAANPLILTIIVLLSEARGGALPRRRVDLYAKIVEVFLDTWERTKKTTSTTFDETSDIDLDAREFSWLLSDLALAMQKNERTLAARWWISDRMQDCLQRKLGFDPERAKDAGERILRYVTERTGLIEERGLDQFGFSHRTLQEYFAALGIIDESDSSRTRDISTTLRGYFFNPRWREVVRLVAAQLTPSLAESLISSILDDPDPIGRFLRRGTLLALQCLSDGATVPRRDLVTSIFGSLSDLGRSKWLGITLEALDILDSFRGTRLESSAHDAIEKLLTTSKAELSPSDYATIHRNARWSALWAAVRKPLSQADDSLPAWEFKIDVDGTPEPLVLLNFTLLGQNASLWVERACALLEDGSASNLAKEYVIRELRKHLTTPRVRESLGGLLKSSVASSRLRRACAYALEEGSDHGSLVAVLADDSQETSVRAECAAALETAARSDAAIKTTLLNLLSSSAPDRLRRGAAFGLSKAAVEDAPVATALLNIVRDKSVAFTVRAACTSALDPLLGKRDDITSTFEELLAPLESPGARQSAAQSLAVAMSSDRVPWDHGRVERIAEILMGLENPCSHALQSLEALAATRETRSGLRLETVLRDALKGAGLQVDCAFVFGSTARQRQVADSDIDLMLIGDVRLKDVATPLRTAERVLGRHVQPAIYSRNIFREKYQSGDPFLTDVMRREKLPVIPSGESAEELANELRAMVAERVASAI